MALSDLYFVTQDLDSYFVDKDTGLPLANGILTFYQDNARTVLQPVYTLTGAPPYNPDSYVALPNPIILSAVGTVQDAGGDNVPIYYYPWILDPDGNLELSLYYVVCTDQYGNKQFTREAWPNLTGNDIPNANNTTFENQISNPTFTNTFLNPGIANILTVTGASNQVIPLGPDWDFVVSGTGTITVQQIPITGLNQVPTNPPYALDVNVSTGITQCWLRQRFSSNSGLWTTTTNNNVFLSASYVAENQSGGTSGIDMYYSDTGNPPVLLIQGTFQSTYEQIIGLSPQIPASLNPNSGTNGYIDIYLAFTPSSHVRVTAIQVIPLENPVDVFAPDFNSSNRNEAYQGDYYIPRNNAKPTNSFLVGWDFPVSPFQFGTTGFIYASPTQAQSYICDQTIAQCTGANVTWSRDTATTNGLSFTSTDANNAFYIMQYLSASQVYDMIGNKLAVNVFGYQTDTVSSNPITMKVYLLAGNTSATPAASIPTLPTMIGSIASNGVFTPTAGNGWSFITRDGLPTAQVTLNNASTLNPISYESNDYGFSGWDLTKPIQTTPSVLYPNLFAIVVSFSYVSSGTSLTIGSISVVPGDLPCRPAIKSPDETLRQCQYYYEQSYPFGSTGSSTAGLQYSSAPTTLYGLVGGSPLSCYAAGFELSYGYKRVNPNLTFYDGLGATNAIQFSYWNGSSYPTPVSGSNPFSLNIGSFGRVGITQTSVFYKPVVTLLLATFSGGGTASIQGYLIFHFQADARLGIV